jgi:hypothetical protein
MALGSTILATGEEEAQARNEMLRSGHVPKPEKPPLGSGISRTGSSAGAADVEGRPSLQARVALGTRVDRLDNLLPRTGWRIVSRHRVPRELFSERQRRLLGSLQTQFAHVSRGASGDTSFYDIDAEYDRWYLRNGQKAFLERPDHYVFGTSETIEDLPSLVDELATILAAAGWNAARDTAEA